MFRLKCFYSIKQHIKKYLSLFFILIFILCQNTNLYAVSPLVGTLEERLENQRNMTIDTNEITDWPQGPIVTAESAILMEAYTGVILYSKNIHEKQYPASTTKILSTLIAAEEASLDEIVTFSSNAVYSIPRGSNNIAMNANDTLTMEECLNAILIRSANEVAYAVAEHVGGSFEGFAEMMNTKAKELGCLNSNFVNPNGLPDENHYTTAYDLAMIGRAFFANEMLCKMTLTPMLKVQKASGEYRDANQMKLLAGKEYAYPYLVGCKTGYTEAARNTLVSCAEKDGLKLICVVLRDENPQYYEDTIALFDYGFANFEKINISETETKYNIDDSSFFYNQNDIFGNSKPILSLNKEDYIVLPKTIDFRDVVSTISYNTGKENQVADIAYTYNDVYLGSASVDFIVDNIDEYSFDIISDDEETQDSEDNEDNQDNENNENDKNNKNNDDTSEGKTVIIDNTDDNSSSKKGNNSFLFINVFKVLLYVLLAIAIIGLLIILRIIIKAIFTKINLSSKKNTRWNWRKDRLRRLMSFKSISNSNYNDYKKLQKQRKRESKRSKRR